jgi:hypothetical protein
LAGVGDDEFDVGDVVGDVLLIYNKINKIYCVRTQKNNHLIFVISFYFFDAKINEIKSPSRHFNTAESIAAMRTAIIKTITSKQNEMKKSTHTHLILI